MKIMRFQQNDRIQYGELVDGGRIRPLEGELHALRPIPGGAEIPLSSVKLLSPTAPTKVLAMGPGHRNVIQGEPPERPTIYFKPSTGVVNPGDPIIFPPEVSYVNHEGELGIVIGRAARRVSREQ